MDSLYNTHFNGMEWRPWTTLWIKDYSLVIKLHSHTMVGCDELTHRRVQRIHHLLFGKFLNYIHWYWFYDK